MGQNILYSRFWLFVLRFEFFCLPAFHVEGAEVLEVEPEDEEGVSLFYLFRLGEGEEFFVDGDAHDIADQVGLVLVGMDYLSQAALDVLVAFLDPGRPHLFSRNGGKPCFLQLVHPFRP